MQEVINKLKEIELTDIKVEVIGSWLWVSGDTFKIKDNLKTLGFFYSHNKKAWFFNGSDHKINRAFCKSLDEIKNKYSSQEISLNEVA